VPREGNGGGRILRPAAQAKQDGYRAAPPAPLA
jgi:hypothetical protein